MQVYDTPTPPHPSKPSEPNRSSHGSWYYSDAHGAAGSWHVTKPMPEECVEQSAIELFSPPAPAGRLLVNCRGYPGFRSSMVSDDGGLSWSSFRVMKDLEGPGVKGGTARLAGTPQTLAFANPRTHGTAACSYCGGRTNLTLSLSEDNGASWPRHILFWPYVGHGYSDTTALADGNAGVHFVHSPCAKHCSRWPLPSVAGGTALAIIDPR